MHLRNLIIGALAVFCGAAAFSPSTARTAEEETAEQSVLVECPTWHWAVSQIPEVYYELCFDDIDHCVEANVGDEICIPSMGRHDVWVTAIDAQGAEPVYYDGDISPVKRVGSADFDGTSLVGFGDVLILIQDFGLVGERRTDLDGDALVGLSDFFLILDAFGKCVSHSGYIYETC